MKSYPVEAICFHFVRKTPWTEDMKRKAEESFEEIFRACDKTFVFVEYESTQENVTDEAKLFDYIVIVYITVIVHIDCL